jgi:hypothetical protein
MFDQLCEFLNEVGENERRKKERAFTANQIAEEFMQVVLEFDDGVFLKWTA